MNKICESCGDVCLCVNGNKAPFEMSDIADLLNSVHELSYNVGFNNEVEEEDKFTDEPEKIKLEKCLENFNAKYRLNIKNTWLPTFYDFEVIHENKQITEKDLVLILHLVHEYSLNCGLHNGMFHSDNLSCLEIIHRKIKSIETKINRHLKEFNEKYGIKIKNCWKE